MHGARGAAKSKNSISDDGHHVSASRAGPRVVPLYKRLCGLDRRSIALWRVGLVATCLYDLYHRSHHFRQFYTDEGQHPRTIAIEHFSSYLWFSLHFFSGTPFASALIWLFHVALLLILAVGYRTRLMFALCWLMCISLQTRNELVLHSGDVYMRAMLFFGIWLPHEECVYSIDAALADNPESGSGTRRAERERRRDVVSTRDGSNVVCDWTTIAISMQIAILYVSSCFHKSGVEWTSEYTATWYALQLDFFCKPFGDVLLMLPDGALKFLTFAVWNWEYYAPALYFVPVYFDLARGLAVFGLFFMHLSFGLGFRLAMFTWITMTSQLLLIPSGFWDCLLLPWLRRCSEYTRTRVLFSRRKRLYAQLACIATTLCCLPEVRVESAETNRAAARAAFAAATDDERDLDEAMRVEMDAAPLSVVGPDGVVHTGLDALVAFARASPLLWALAAPMRWPVVSTGFRMALRVAGTADWLLVRPHAFEPRKRLASVRGAEQVETARDVLRFVWFLARNVIAALTIICCWWWVYASLNQVPSVPPRVFTYMVATQLAQEWSMFSPHPPNTGFVMFMPGNLTDDSQVDLFAERGLFRWHGAPLTWKAEPKYEYAASIGNHRTFKAYEAMIWGQGYDDGIDTMRLHFGRWICREWNARHEGGKQLWAFEWYMVSHTLSHETKRREVFDKSLLWSHYCFDVKPKV